MRLKEEKDCPKMQANTRSNQKQDMKRRLCVRAEKRSSTLSPPDLAPRFATCGPPVKWSALI